MTQKYKTLSAVVALFMILPGLSQVQASDSIVGGIKADSKAIEARFSGRPYSPWAETGFPRQVYWGDTHLHTALSVDAGLFGARLGLEEAYRFARGEQITSSTGQPVKLSRPLDWLVIADHSDGMGLIKDLSAGSPEVTKYEQGARWAQGLQEGGQKAVDTALDLITNFSQGTVDQNLMAAYSPGSTIYASVWDDVVEAAEAYNNPGHFTTIIGFEWTSLVKGNNLHRNVLFRDNGVRAGQVVPYTTYAPIGSTDPLDLYKWMENYENKTGGTVLAIAHNGNLSNGLMFPIDAQYTGRKLDNFYVEQRARWEVMYEVTQIKGDGETHPFLSPDDAFADYETWDAGNLDLSEAKTNDMLKGEYAREALKNGLVLESKLGTNPYKFGMVGSTDSHTGLSAIGEDNFFGKHSGGEPSPERMSHPFTKTEFGVFEGYETAASGFAAVWATENTREAIFDAMARKEVYGTTGPRMMVRFFGGWDYTMEDVSSRSPVHAGYSKGVPMGGNLHGGQEGKTPSFMVYSLRDPIGANLDRIQIVKGWLDKSGNTQEKIYNVAWSDPESRNIDAKGQIPPVGNTVSIEDASWTNTIGASELGTVWSDPDFDPGVPAFYYARVLEIPTPRWVVYDAKYYGVKIPEGATTIHQERAYTSPIWYTP